MRIIGGNKGRIRINPPKNLKLRPTTDRCKESLFNIINNDFDLDQCEVLDLFSGTGNISYEFCSRGAKRVISVESNIKALNFIKKFSVENGFNIETIRSDVFTYLKKIQSKFDIIFSDPPYNLDKKKYIEIINQVFKNKYLKKNGILIIEHSSKIDFKSTHYFNKSKTYGDTIFTFFQNINY